MLKHLIRFSHRVEKSQQVSWQHNDVRVLKNSRVNSRISCTRGVIDEKAGEIFGRRSLVKVASRNSASGNHGRASRCNQVRDRIDDHRQRSAIGTHGGPNDFAMADHSPRSTRG